MSAAQTLETTPAAGLAPDARIADALRLIRRDHGRAVHTLAQESVAFFACRGEMRVTDVITTLVVEKDVPFELQPFIETALSELRKHDVLEWRGMGRIHLTKWAESAFPDDREQW